MSKVSVIDVFPSEDYRRGYVAGFFDADGFVGLYIHNTPKPSIVFTNTHVYVLDWLRTSVFQDEGIDYIYAYRKSRQIKIYRWDQIEKFVEKFKNLCIVKRSQLELLDEAIRKRRELRKHRKGRRLYSDRNIEDFRKIAQRIKDERQKTKENWELTNSGYFPI